MLKNVINRPVAILAAGLAAGLLFTGSLLNQAQAAAPAPESKGWESSAAAGLTLTRGNSSTLLGTLSLQTARKWTRDELFFGAGAAYGENNGAKNAETFSAYGQYNHLFNERLYAGLRVDFLHDGIADLRYRFTISPLLGYYFIKDARTRLSVEGGPTFIYESQSGNQRGYFAARVAERFEHKINDRTRIWQYAEWIPQVDDIDNWILNAEVGIDTAITKALSLRVVLQDTYDNQTPLGILHNDLKLIAGVAYKF